MRLIDADALKKDFNLNFGGVSHAAAAAEIIGFSDDWAVNKARPRVEIEIVETEDDVGGDMR